jgi:N-glycosidase YbiA
MKNQQIPNISSFTGDYRFLSNFYPSDVELDGIVYPSVEHAYQAAKTLDKEERKVFHKRPLPSAAEAKKLGRKSSLRSDWEGVKLQVMEDLLVQKFAHKELQEQLLATGQSLLVEGNWWGDSFWGVDNKKGGQNHLGKLLMKIRKSHEKV